MQGGNFDVSMCVKDQVPCWYAHLNSRTPCGGYGHFARHRAAAYTDKAKQEVDERRSANPGKGKGGGKGKGKGKKGGRGRGSQQLNMQGEPREQNETAGKDAAQRFLDALMVADYTRDPD